jgi:hypothetical protein
MQRTLKKLSFFNRPIGMSGESIKHLTNAPGPKNKVSELVFPKGLRFEGLDDISIKGKIGGDKEPIYVKGDMVFKNGFLDKPVILESSWKNKRQIELFFKGEKVIDEKGQEITEVFFKTNGKPMYVKALSSFSPKSVQQFKYSTFETELKEAFSITEYAAEFNVAT